MHQASYELSHPSRVFPLCRDAHAVLVGVWLSISHPSSSSPDQYGEPVVIITHWELTHTSACVCMHTHTHIHTYTPWPFKPLYLLV